MQYACIIQFHPSLDWLSQSLQLQRNQLPDYPNEERKNKWMQLISYHYKFGDKFHGLYVLQKDMEQQDDIHNLLIIKIYKL